MKKYYFISGFPRSGSTLLAGILNQNPKFHATMSSTLHNLFCDVQFNYFRDHDAITLSNDAAKNIYLKILDGYYQHVDADVVFDTNRNWPRFDAMLTSLLPHTKLICCVRDIPSILNSFEYYYKFVSAKAPTFVEVQQAVNPWDRLEGWWQGLILNQYENCEYAFSSPALKDMYIFIDYDDLVTNPHKTIGDLYLRLGLDYYHHDFDNVNHSFEAIDKSVSNEGLHTVKKKVCRTNTKWVLPQSAVEKYSRRCFWREL